MEDFFKDITGLNKVKRAVGTLVDTIKYMKNRTKNKFYGDRFEEWVVRNSNIRKNNDKEHGFWELVEWRSDKYIKGYYAPSNRYPDLRLKSISDKSTFYHKDETILVECKWRSKKNFYISNKKTEIYEAYKNQINAKKLFYVFGIRWNGNQPEEVYIIPSERIKKAVKNTDKDNQFEDCKHIKGFIMYGENTTTCKTSNSIQS